ncbi:hypothetical protein HKBW3S06_01234, partial [Candidatus Hakubella thermalkaliphila]
GRAGRGFLYTLTRALGDLSALFSGDSKKRAKRAGRRATGKATGKAFRKLFR